MISQQVMDRYIGQDYPTGDRQATPVLALHVALWQMQIHRPLQGFYACISGYVAEYL